MREPAPQASSGVTGIAVTSTGTPDQPHTPKTGSRKRVFTFQKRWLHSLPIVQRTLPETEMDGRVLKAVRTAGGSSAVAAVTAAAAADAESYEEVIVCMLCDDPASKRELTKVWSPLNCRRGRIENHLLSKHPEFMRLLKHKREAEGDLAVQIFLQNLREGRCNARTEINNGLYSQLTIGSTARASPVADVDKRTLGDYINEREDFENNRKRAKLGNSSANSKDAAMAAYSAVGVMMRTNGSAEAVDGLTSNVLYQDAAMSAQWQTVFYNKLVVITGGNNKAMASVATQLWLLGANVLLTFTNISALDDFNTKHIGRFPDPSDSEEGPRGVMLPVLGSFRTHKDISDWCGSLAAKYQRVDFLINYVGSEVVEGIAAGDKQSERVSKYPAENEPIVSSVALMEALSELMPTCFPDPAASEDGWLTSSSGTIINIASTEDDGIIEPLMKSLAAKLQLRNVQVNCVLLPYRQSIDTADVEIPEGTAALLHSILFLLSPSSRLLSGSVLRLQEDKTLSQAAADRRSEATADAIDSI